VKVETMSTDKSLIVNIILKDYNNIPMYHYIICQTD